MSRDEWPQDPVDNNGADGSDQKSQAMRHRHEHCGSVFCAVVESEGYDGEGDAPGNTRALKWSVGGLPLADGGNLQDESFA